MTKPAPILKYPGAKWRLAKWIISHFPKHTTYLEPFFGSGAVFFNKPRSKAETLNDLDGNVVNLFKIIRDRTEEFSRAVELTPWARDEYDASYEKTGDELEDARRFLVRCWQAHGTKTASRTGWKSTVQGLEGSNGVMLWEKMAGRIIPTAKRLRQAQIENQPATQIIERYKYVAVLIYADPPYPLKTRAGKMYAHEMTNADHVELLDTLDAHPGPVVLSGYACQLYDERLNHWTRRELMAQAEKGKTRTEVLWINPVAAKSLQMRLFDEVIH